MASGREDHGLLGWLGSSSRHVEGCVRELRGGLIGMATRLGRVAMAAGERCDR